MDITQQASGPAPDVSLANLEQRLRRGRIGFGCLLVFGGAEILIGLYSAWFYVTIAALGRQYGWGNIPPEAFPVEPSAIVPLFNTLDWAQRIAFLASGAAFLYGLTQYRRSLESLMGGQPFQFGWGWTIGSLFIPFWNLYRPWVGFAEVRRAALGIVARQRVSLEWKSDPFSTATLVLGLSYFIGSVTLQILAGRAETISKNPSFGLEAVDLIRDLLIIDVGARGVIVGVMLWYLRTIVAALRKVDASFLVASRFD